MNLKFFSKCSIIKQLIYEKGSDCMRTIANILWIVFGGLVLSVMWLLAGLILCITIVGIPFGVQCFKFASLMLTPFGKEIVYSGGTGSFLMNVLWIVCFGLNFALWSVAIGLFGAPQLSEFR